MWLVMELADGGSLYSFLASNQSLTWNERYASYICLKEMMGEADEREREREEYCSIS